MSDKDTMLIIPEMISVKDRLPNSDDLALVKTGDNRYRTGFMDMERIYEDGTLLSVGCVRRWRCALTGVDIDDLEEVTHWIYIDGGLI